MGAPRVGTAPRDASGREVGLDDAHAARIERGGAIEGAYEVGHVGDVPGERLVELRRQREGVAQAQDAAHIPPRDWLVEGEGSTEGSMQARHAARIPRIQRLIECFGPCEAGPQGRHAAHIPIIQWGIEGQRIVEGILHGGHTAHVPRAHVGVEGLHGSIAVRRVPRVGGAAKKVGEIGDGRYIPRRYWPMCLVGQDDVDAPQMQRSLQ